jgi:hypothetical protein
MKLRPECNTTPTKLPNPGGKHTSTAFYSIKASMHLVLEPPRFRHGGQDKSETTAPTCRHEVRADSIAGQGAEQRSAGYTRHKEQVRTPGSLALRSE